jgi:hypothetical protein
VRRSSDAIRRGDHIARPDHHRRRRHRSRPRSHEDLPRQARLCVPSSALLRKTLTSIVVEAIYGGPKVVEYLDFVGDALGFNLVEGSCVTSLEPSTEKQERTNDSILAAHSKRFYARRARPSWPAPTFLHLLMLRMGRTKIRMMLDETCRDYKYYREKGWFESDYFHPVRLNPLKQAAGRLFDCTASKSTNR